MTSRFMSRMRSYAAAQASASARSGTFARISPCPSVRSRFMPALTKWPLRPMRTWVEPIRCRFWK